MPRLFVKEGRFYCDADTEEAALMKAIVEADEVQKEALARKKSNRSRLEEIALEGGEVEPVYLESPDFEAHWEYVPRPLKTEEWELLWLSFPKAYEALNGDDRKSKPFLVVTRKKK